MIESTYSLYKLIVLYILKETDMALTNAQITDLFLTEEYTSYFHLQEVLGDMVESGLLTAQKTHNATSYLPTEKGRQVLTYFQSEISREIRTDIKAYLTNKGLQIRNDASLLADYRRISPYLIEVHLQALDEGIPFIDLKITVPQEAIAAKICDRWKENAHETYEMIMRQLSPSSQNEIDQPSV